MTGDAAFRQVAELLRERNDLDARIAALVGRPALSGHIGEWIAAQVFGIELDAVANRKAVDGHFITGPLTGATVNVKWFAKRDGTLDMVNSDELDYYLVLTGPKAAASSSRNGTRPLVVANVYLFSAPALAADLRSRGRAVGTAASVRAALWAAAEIYPRSSETLPLTESQRGMLGLLGGR
jgi:hypothetical protein